MLEICIKLHSVIKFIHSLRSLEMLQNLNQWIAEQYNANLFEGCHSYDDVYSILEGVSSERFDVDFDVLVKRCWEYIQERLPE